MTKARDIASAAPAPSTVSATEIGYLDGVSSAIQTQLDAKVAKSLVDAKGDLLVGSANDTVSRLAVASTAGYVLTVDSAEATGVKWAAAAAGGKVLQVVQSATNSETTVASTSFTDTNLSATITPTKSDSKILVLISQSVYVYRNKNTGEQNFNYAVVQLLRGSTSIRDFGYVQSFACPGLTGLGMHSGSTVCLEYLDSPATTSSTTYKTQGKVGYTANDGWAGFQFSLTGSNQGYSTMTLLEIGA